MYASYNFRFAATPWGAVGLLLAGILASTIALAQSNTPQIEQRLSNLMACEDEQLLAKQLSIRESIADSRLCETDSDCQMLNPGCPFGCSVGVHKDQIAGINEALNEFRAQAQAACGSCAYECPQQDDVKCLDNYCTPVRNR